MSEFSLKGLRQTPEVDSRRREEVLLSRLSRSGVMSQVSISGFLLWAQEPPEPRERSSTSSPRQLLGDSNKPGKDVTYSAQLTV